MHNSIQQQTIMPSTERFQFLDFFLQLRKVVIRKTFIQVDVDALLHLHPQLCIAFSLELGTHRLQPQSFVELPFQLRMEPSCYVQLHRHPLSHARNSLLKNLGVVLNFHLIVPGNELNYLLNLSDSVYDFYLSLTDFLFESIVEQNCKFPTKHCLMNFLSLALVFSVCQAVYTFELFAHETVVSERFIMMKSLLAPSRTVVRRSRLPNVLAFPITPMKISKTLFAVRLLVFNTKSFSIGYLTVSTENTLCLPFSDFPQHELGIVLPLILFGISDKIFMRKD